MRGNYLRRIPRAMLGLALAGSLGGCASVNRQILYSPRTEAVAATWVHGPPRPITVSTQDGLRLHGYAWPGAVDDPDIFLFFHGRNWNADMAANAAQHLVGWGNAVLVASYRGFGDNPGSPSETGLLRDAAAFIAAAREVAGPQARIWLVGHSLGSAVALQAAADDPHVKGVFAMSAFTRIAAAAPKLGRAFIPDRWNNLDALKRLHVPVIFIQGGLDRLIPPDSGDMLLSTYAGPSRLIVGETSRHNPDMALLAPWLNQTIAAMSDQSPATMPPPPSGWAEKGQHP